MTCPEPVWHASIWITFFLALASCAANSIRAYRYRRGGGSLWRLSAMQTAIALYTAFLFAILGCGTYQPINDMRILFRTAITLLIIGQLAEALMDL